MATIRYEPISPADIPAAYEFIVNYFYPFEPMNRAYINRKEPAQENLDFVAAYLHQQPEVCIKAVDNDSDKIVGLSLGHLTGEDDARRMLDAAIRTLDRKWADVLEFLVHVHDQADIEGKFGVSCPYEILIVAVHPDYGRRSIAKELVIKQMELAKAKGSQAVYVDCSSKYTAKIMEKLDFTQVSEIVFADYRTAMELQIFEPEDDVHTVMRSYYKALYMHLAHLSDGIKTLHEWNHQFERQSRMANNNPNDDDGVVQFSVAKAEDYDLACEFVLQYYYQDEPMNNSYVYGSSPAEDDVEFSVSFLLQGMAVKAVDPAHSNRLAGISIANPIYPGYKEDLLAAAKSAKTQKWRDSLKLLAHLQESANVLERFSVDKCYDIEIVAVHPDYRGRSIGAKLLEEQFKRAKELGYPLVSADCSSWYSARIAERVGMECVGRLAYSDYRNEDGEQLFQPKPPHIEIASFVKEI